MTAAWAPPSRSSQHAAHWRGQIVLVEQTLDGAAVELAQHLQPLRLQPLQQPGDLVDPGDGAAGELGELGVDLGCRGLCNPTRSFGKLPIDVKAALVDPAAEHPQRLFCRRQRRQPVIQLAQHFAVLHAVFAEPIAAARRSSNQYVPAGSSPWRGFRGFDIWRISRSPAASLRCASSSASAAAPSFAGSPSARHIAMVQRCRSSGTIGQPWRGASTCCSMAVSKASLCATTTQLGFAAASTNSGGTGSPGQPQLHGTVVDGICHAQNFRRRVSRVLVRADLLQADLAPGLDVAKQDVRNGDVALGRGAVGERLMHGRYRQLCGNIAKQAGVREAQFVDFNRLRADCHCVTAMPRRRAA